VDRVQEVVEDVAARAAATPPANRDSVSPAASHFLALQRQAGNRAVARMLRRAPRAPQQGPVIGGSPQPLSRAAFEQTMKSRFGVATFDYTDWDPGDLADLYQSIVAGFTDFSTALGGTPTVTKIAFLAAGGSGEAADFGAGKLEIYRKITSGSLWLPLDRSNRQNVYPPVLGGTIGAGKGGSPIPLPALAASQRRVIVHELGHGAVEGMMTPGPSAPALDAKLIKDFAAASGWYGGVLYDIGDSAVQSALAATPPRQPTTSPITANDWNDPKWTEQPIGDYPLVGPHEDFPQSLMAYIYAPDLLKKRSPHRYAFLDSRKASWSPVLKSPPNP
jgi:hypothetical protein